MKRVIQDSENRQHDAGGSQARRKLKTYIILDPSVQLDLFRIRKNKNMTLRQISETIDVSLSVVGRIFREEYPCTIKVEKRTAQQIQTYARWFL